MRRPLDPFSKVLDERSHWDPEWYSWLEEIATATTRLETTVPPETDLSALEADIAVLQAQVAALQVTSPPGLVFISSQAASSSAALVFTGIGSTYDAYQFHITKMKPSVDSTNLLMQMSIDGGSTWKNTANAWTWLYSYLVGGSAAFGHSSTAEGNQIYFRITGNQQNNWNCTAEVTLYPSTPAINLNMLTWRGLVFHPSTSVYQQIGSGAELSDSTSCNAVRFFFSAGNIVSGRISMYGLRKT